MQDIVIVSAVRTPVGKFGGSLAKTPATELGSIVIREALARAKVGLDQVGEVIMGQVLAAGCGQNPARQALMKAGVAKETPALTINAVCGSGLKAVMLAAQAVACGDSEIVVAGGQENMSLSPHVLNGSREDHIVPINSAYATTQVLPGEKRFVMGASGHIAGVINPPAKKKRSHWVREDGKLPATLQGWLAGADELPGSWWDDWSEWLKGHAGKQIAAPKDYGRAPEFKAIEPAPGRYVKQKA